MSAVTATAAAPTITATTNTNAMPEAPGGGMMPPNDFDINPDREIPKGFHFDPLQQLLEQLAELLKLLQGLTGPGKITPPWFPPVDTQVKQTVFEGETVGTMEVANDKYAPPSLLTLNVENVVGAYTSEKAALAAAKRHSLANGGEAVAIVKSVLPGYNPPTYPAEPAAPGAPVPNHEFYPQPQPTRVVYNVVTLDPAISPDYASQVRNGYGTSNILHLVAGNRSEGVPQFDYALPPGGYKRYDTQPAETHGPQEPLVPTTHDDHAVAAAG